MTRLGRQEGFTLVEMLVGAMLMIIVMSATLGVLDQFRGISARADKRVDLQDSARQASRTLARSLRNLAASPDLPGVVERASAYDLVFRAVDNARAWVGGNTRNLKRVRYCLDASNPSRATLREQTQRWTSSSAPSLPSSTACPAGGWGESRVIADRMTNRANGANRPLWTYGTTATGQITSIKVNLFMSQAGAPEVALQTGVFLRNQNRAPTAVFSANAVGVRHVMLNGSGSTDPEGDALDYIWYVNNAEVGQGLIFDYAAPDAGTYVIRLVVRDPSGLAGESVAQSVVVS